MTVFPFAAIVGQDDLKQALLIAAIDPKIGGVLAFGDRGTGKTTTIRALAALLPQIETIRDCPYRCAPKSPQGLCNVCTTESKSGPHAVETVPTRVINLPLGATEDRVLGALDLETALVRGEMRFEPGLLAKAHRGFLYVDEINLLEDHLVDVLLDVAASGRNLVEREGLSIEHEASFVLVGSGNPEEGELRPQLLDRFGLSVDVRTPQDLKQRIEVIKRRDAYERDPAGYGKLWARETRAVCDQVVAAKAKLDAVDVSEPVLEKIAELCIALGSDGLRGELTLMRAGRALAALEGLDAVTVDHVRRMAPSALGHRLRKDALDDTESRVRVDRAVEAVLA